MKNLLLYFAVVIALSFTSRSYANERPVLDGIYDTIYRATPNTPFQFSFAQLRAAVVAWDFDEDPIRFKVVQQHNGTLFVDGVLATADTFIGPASVLIWHPPVDVEVVSVEAFEIHAFDGQAFSIDTVIVQISVGSMDHAPELYEVRPFTTAYQEYAFSNKWYALSFSKFAEAVTARDLDDNPLTYKISKIHCGTVQLNDAVVSSGVMFGPADTIRWLPPMGFIGITNAFSVAAYDGALFSTNTADVTIEVIEEIDLTPRFQAGGNVVVIRDSGQYLKGWATGIYPNPYYYSLHFSAVSDNPALFAEAPTIQQDGRLRFTPAPGALGVANIAVTLHDQHGLASPTANFSISVLNANYPPTATLPGTVEINEDAGLRVIPGFMTNLSPGVGDPAQVISWRVITDKPSFYSQQPIISTNGTLTFKVAPNAYGTDPVRLVLKDNGGTANGGKDLSVNWFTIVVSPVNDSPTITNTTFTVLEERNLVAKLTIQDVDSSLTNITLSVASFDPAKIASALITQTGSDIKLSVTPARDAFGITSLKIATVDGGNTNIHALTLKIQNINDPPTIALASSQVVASYLTGLNSVPGFASSTSGAQESDLVSFVVVPSNPAAFIGKPNITANGELIFKLAKTFTTGTTSLAVYAKDNGGTLNGGSNLSASSRFNIQVAGNNVTAAAGIYNGLAQGSTNIAIGNSGSISLSLSTLGALSGKFETATNSVSFTGRIDTLGNLTASGKGITVTGLVHKGEIAGTVTRSAGISNFQADKAIYDGVLKIAPLAGKYTLKLQDGNQTPNATGIGNISVAANGKVTSVSTLGDGTTVSTSTTISRYGDIPLFSSLYGGGGQLIGWLKLTNHPSGDVFGTLIWQKADMDVDLFTAGSAFAGELFQRGQGNATLRLGVPMNAPVVVGTNTIVIPSFATRLSLNSKNGRVLGPVNTAKVTAVYLPKQNQVIGPATSPGINGDISITIP